MSALPKKKQFTVSEYLALEEHAEYKSEYFNGEIFAMAGATSPHVKISANMTRQLGNHLEGTPCFPMGNDMLVHVEATGLHTYPDVIVVCGEEKYEDEKQRVLLNPAVLVEVASPSTEKYDRTVKLRHYKQIPTLNVYLIVAQDEPVVESFTREGNVWIHTSAIGLTEQLSIPAIGVTIPLAKIYERVTFPEAEASDPRPNA